MHACPCVHVCACIPVCMCTCVCLQVCLGVCMCVEAKLCVSSSILPTLYLIKGLSVNLEFFDYPSILAGQSAAGSSCLCTHSTWIERLCGPAWLLHGFWGSNSSPHVWVVVTLLTELSPQPQGEECLDPNDSSQPATVREEVPGGRYWCTWDGLQQTSEHTATPPGSKGNPNTTS